MKVPSYWERRFENMMPGIQEIRRCNVNHPLVNSGDAFWSNKKQLCLGYKLKNNNKIFRPIFDFQRQKLINKFLKNIHKIVLKREKNLIYLEIIKIKKLPIEIINIIINMI
jgi:hypothetical protein